MTANEVDWGSRNGEIFIWEIRAKCMECKKHFATKDVRIFITSELKLIIVSMCTCGAQRDLMISFDDFNKIGKWLTDPHPILAVGSAECAGAYLFPEAMHFEDTPHILLDGTPGFGKVIVVGDDGSWDVIKPWPRMP